MRSRPDDVGDECARRLGKKGWNTLTLGVS